MSQAEDSNSTPVLTVADLSADAEHEARILDIKLGASLGFGNPLKIRELIRRHLPALRKLANLATIDEISTSKGGRPSRAYWLTKTQALFICTKSETPRATEATIEMVRVFDAYTRGTLPPRDVEPPRQVAGPAPVPFLPGTERLVSSLHVAQALRRRHTGILRLLDAMAAERPDLYGPHIWFSTYMHENGKPYRCFHLDRIGFEALMLRIPITDLAAAELRDVTLSRWSAEQLAIAPPKKDHRSVLERSGLAVVRIGDETVLVDMARFEPAEGERAVLINFNGEIRLDEAVCHYPHMNWCGRRIRHVLTKTEQNGGTFQETGWIIGTVIEAKATKPIDRGEVVSSTSAAGRRDREPKLRSTRAAREVIRSFPIYDFLSLPIHGSAGTARRGAVLGLT